jgi:hypothetical protein
MQRRRLKSCAGSTPAASIALVAETSGDAKHACEAFEPEEFPARSRQGVVDGAGLVARRRTAPGGTPITRLNARAKAASER